MTKKSKVVTKYYKEADLDNIIGQVIKDAGSLQQKIHNVAVSVIKVWHDANGDADAALLAVKRINALQEASPYHRRAFSVWVGEMLPLQWSEDSSTWYIHADNHRLMGKPFIAARDVPFWEVSKPTSAQPFILTDKWDQFYAAVIRKADKPKDEDVIDLEVMRHMRELDKLIQSKVA
jgi:hypothetical protein